MSDDDKAWEMYHDFPPNYVRSDPAIAQKLVDAKVRVSELEIELSAVRQELIKTTKVADAKDDRIRDLEGMTREMLRIYTELVTGLQRT